jgi:hypothetical protein
MEYCAPTPEHAWLKRFIGTWDSTAEFPAHGDQPASTLKGKETFRALGEYWVVGQGSGDMPGGCTGDSMVTIGYDPALKCYVGTWIGSPMAKLWVYENGKVDPATNTLTLECDGPSFSGEGTARYRDVLQFTSQDERTLTASVQNPDGSWNQFMKVTYRRDRQSVL